MTLFVILINEQGAPAITSADVMNRNTGGRNELRPYGGSGITSPPT